MEAHHLGAPGAESQRFSARSTCSFHRSWLAAHFCSFYLAACQLAAQLSVLAALEDSIAVGLSRVMGPPVQVAAPFLLTLARLWLPLLRQRPQCLQRCLRTVMRWRPPC